MPGSFTKRLLDELKKTLANSGIEELVGKISKIGEEVFKNDGNGTEKAAEPPKNLQSSEAEQKDMDAALKDDIKRGLQRFKMGMMLAMPFYGDILMRVEIREDSGIETAQTNGRMISYNPAFFATLNEGQRNYVLLHEVLHILLLHWKRNAQHNPTVWNIACDYVVNGMIDSRIINDLRRKNDSVKLERPPQGCFERWYYGKSAEEYYQEISAKLK